MKLRLALLLLIFIVLPVAAQQPTAAAANPDAAYMTGGMLDGRKIMEAVNLRYQALDDAARETKQKTTVITRSSGLADHVTEEIEILYLQGDKVRSEIVDHERYYEHPDTADEMKVAGTQRRRVWVHDGKETRMVYETDPAQWGSGAGTMKPIVQGVRIRHSAMPADVSRHFRAPLAATEFDPVFLKAKYYVHESINDGRPMFVVVSAEPIRASENSTFQQVELWIDKESLIITRYEAEIVQTNPNAPPSYISIDSEVNTQLVGSIDPAQFVLELPANTNDLTDQVTAAARKKSQ